LTLIATCHKIKHFLRMHYLPWVLLFLIECVLASTAQLHATHFAYWYFSSYRIFLCFVKFCFNIIFFSGFLDLWLVEVEQTSLCLLSDLSHFIVMWTLQYNAQKNSKYGRLTPCTQIYALWMKVISDAFSEVILFSFN